MVIKMWIIENSSSVSITVTLNQCFIIGKAVVRKWFLIKIRGTFFCAVDWRGRIFHYGIFRGEDFVWGVIWTLLYKCRWIISSWRLDNLPKHVDRGGSNKFEWSIYWWISFSGEPLYRWIQSHAFISNKVFSCYATLIIVVFHFKKLSSKWKGKIQIAQGWFC